MSLTKSAPMAASKRLPVRHIAAALVAIATVATVAFTASQMASHAETADSPSLQLSQREFLELNTTAMPVAPVGAAVASDSALERFIEINTTGIPPMTSITGPAASEEFLYWNVDAFGLDPGVRVAPLQPAGPS